jgi:hypothetical protein
MHRLFGLKERENLLWYVLNIRYLQLVFLVSRDQWLSTGQSFDNLVRKHVRLCALVGHGRSDELVLSFNENINTVHTLIPQQ